MTKWKMNEEEEGESKDSQENTTSVEKEYVKVVFTKFLCETDVGESCSVSLLKEDVENDLPHLAPGKSKMLEFQNTCGNNNFRMEFVRSNLGDYYYFSTGWKRYRNEHKLEEGDLLFLYQKVKQNGIDDDQRYLYLIECEKEASEERESKKQNPTQENTKKVENVKLVFTKFLCEADVGESFSVSILKEDAEDHLPRLAPDKSMMLEFQDTRGNNFSMEFVRSNLGDYYFCTGWERYRDEHKLEYDDMLSVYKKEKQHRVDDDQQYFYIIECQKVTPDHPTKFFLTHVEFVLAKLLAALEDSSKSSVKKETVLAKLLCDQDLYGNSKGLKLQKNEVEENLNERPLARVGGKITLPLFDPIGEKLFQMELVYTDEEEYYIGFGWKEYAAEHNLLTFDSIFVNKIIVNGDVVNHRSANFIWDKDIDDDQLVNSSYYYEIIYQRVSSPPSSSSAAGENYSYF